MRKNSIFKIIIIFYITVFFSSCFRKNNNYSIVTISFNESDSKAEILKGGSLWIVYTLCPDKYEGGKIGLLRLYDSEFNDIFKKYYGETDKITDSIFYKIPSNANPGETIFLYFDICDAVSGNRNTREFQIEVIRPIPVILNATETVNYNSQSDTTEFGWQLVADAKGVTVTQVNSDDADLVFFFNDTYRQQILSPDAEQIMNQEAYSNWDYTLTGKKTTKIEIATEADFTGASPESINDLTVVSAVHPGGGNGVDHVLSGEYYKFELSDGRKGVFKVAESNPPYAKAPIIASSITLEFKWQEEPANSAK